MTRSKPLAALLFSTVALLALTGCHTTVVQPVEQPAAQPAPQPHDDHRDDHHPPPPPPPDHRNDRPQDHR